MAGWWFHSISGMEYIEITIDYLRFPRFPKEYHGLPNITIYYLLPVHLISLPELQPPRRLTIFATSRHDTRHASYPGAAPRSAPQAGSHHTEQYHVPFRVRSRAWRGPQRAKTKATVQLNAEATVTFSQGR